MNLNRAVVSSTEEPEQLLVASLSKFAREAHSVYALVYLIESNEPDGSPIEGFRPGYTATVWPTASISDNWLLGSLSDGTEFYFLPRNKWGEGGDFQLDIVELVTPTFSLTRQ